MQSRSYPGDTWPNGRGGDGREARYGAHVGLLLALAFSFAVWLLIAVAGWLYFQ